ncbi:MAG: AAA family ATPase [Clostridia bacterium]|nr:AAA family ATPase [Clostridia bacterium]
MKLISCHVENYGRLSSKDYDFSSGMNCFYEENGAGKSTLASFIKAMFYGLESYKINSTEFCDRQRYYPFEGGNFGGNLTFEMDGNVYKIERFFGEKSQTQDTLTVYKNGNLSTELGLDIGKTVFGIDKQSFERTAFISGEEIEIKSTSSINSKLSGFLQGGGDLDVDDAVSSLEKLAKEYKKSKGGRDKISAVSEEISSLSEKILNTEAISLALDSKYQRLSDYQNEIDALAKKIESLQQTSKILSEWEYYEHLLTQIEEQQTLINTITQKYSGIIPTHVEVESYSENVIKLRELSAKSSTGLSQDESARLYRLEKAFIEGVPSKQDMITAESDIDSLSKLNAKLSQLSSNDFSQQDKSLVNTFSNNPPTSDKISALEKNVQDYKFFKTEYDCTPDFIGGTKSKKSNSVTYGIIAILSLLATIVGIILINSGVGVALTIIGGLALGISAFLYLSDKLSKVERLENPNKRKLELEIRECEDKIKAVLIPYGYSSGNGVLYDYATFNSNYQRYLEIEKGAFEKDKTKADLQREIKNFISKLGEFFSKYGLTGENFLSNLTRLQSGVDELYSLKKRAENVSAETSKIELETKKIKADVNAFLQKFNLQAISPSEVLSDVKTFETSKSMLENLKTTAVKYKKEKNLDVKPQGGGESLEEISNLLHEREREYSALKHQVVDDEYAVDRLDGYYIDKEQLENTLTNYKQKHKLLTKTAEFLRLAEQNLKDKYVKPVKDEFVKYASVLEKVLGEKVTMTKNFEIRFERAGKERLEKHLSSGILSICAFAFRLAMIKNMYSGAMPFLVLDDPFTTLDETHLKKVKLVIDELAKDTQIIYFTCHSSRKF